IRDLTVTGVQTCALPILDFSGGFAGATGSLTLSGSALINASKLELTNGGGGQSGAAFTTAKVDVSSFATQFTFQLTAGAGTADGFTFTLQNAAPTARGSSGGGLGYGPDHAGGTIGISPSVAIKFDL